MSETVIAVRSPARVMIARGQVQEGKSCPLHNGMRLLYSVEGLHLYKEEETEVKDGDSLLD